MKNTSFILIVIMLFLSDSLSAQKTIPRLKPLTAKVGIYGVGHYTYWEQFDGLLEDLEKKMLVLEDRVKKNNVEVVNFGIGDCADSAYAKLEQMQAANLDLLFVDMLTYATSSSIAPIFKKLDIPIVLVALQPDAALDYDRATTYMQLYNDDICSVPEFSMVAERMGRQVPPAIIGTLYNDPEAENEIARYCQIGKVLHDLKTARIGLMGHVLENMYDMHVDPVVISEAFGCHVVMTEPDDILKHYKNVDTKEQKKYEKLVLDFFETPEPKSDTITLKLTEHDLNVAARAGLALEAFVEEKNLDGLAYYYEGEEGSQTRELMTNLIVGNSLLTSAGFPMVGEFDLKTCMAMFIMDRLEIGGSLAELHPVDFKEDFVIIGHDGPHHINIADKKPLLRSLTKYHGKPGSGASVEFSIQKGPVTILGITQTYDGRLKFVIAEGESKDGKVTPIGNTNTRGVFQPDIRTFLHRWVAEAPTHHFALGVGHHAKTIKEIAGFLGIEAVIVSNEK